MVNKHAVEDLLTTENDVHGEKSVLASQRRSCVESVEDLVVPHAVVHQAAGLKAVSDHWGRDNWSILHGVSPLVVWSGCVTTDRLF